MPKIEKIFRLEITPERFVRECSTTELYELDLLMSSPGVRRRLSPELFKEAVDKPTKQLRIDEEAEAR